MEVFVVSTIMRLERVVPIVTDKSFCPPGLLHVRVPWVLLVRNKYTG